MSTKTQNGGQAVATTPSKNSTAVKAETQTANSPTPNAVEKPKDEPKPIISVADQRAKMEKLSLLFDKEEKLKNTLSNLDSFKLSADGNTSRLELSDGKGSSFKTTAPVFVGAVLDLIREEAEKQLLQTNGEIIALA